MASEQNQATTSAPEAPSTAAHTDPKPEAKKEGWFHKTFVRKGGQDDYPNGKSWSLEPPHPRFHQHDSKKKSTEVEARGLGRVEANQGTATKWLDVTTIHDFYDGACESGKEAKVVVNMFVCSPRELEKRDDAKMVFPVKVLERHPFTAQMFVPVGVSEKDTTVRYLVIVAPTLPSSNDETSTSTASPSPAGATRKGPGPPDLDNIEAFLATGDQAVTYAAGTWHAPMVVLGERSIDFVVAQYSNGVGLEDCQEYYFDADTDVEVDVGDDEVLKSKL